MRAASTRPEAMLAVADIMQKLIGLYMAIQLRSICLVVKQYERTHSKPFHFVCSKHRLTGQALACINAATEAAVVITRTNPSEPRRPSFESSALFRP